MSLEHFAADPNQKWGLSLAAFKRVKNWTKFHNGTTLPTLCCIAIVQYGFAIYVLIGGGPWPSTETHGCTGPSGNAVMNGNFASPPNIGPFWLLNASGIENEGIIYPYAYSSADYTYTGNALKLSSSAGVGTLVQIVPVTPGAMYRLFFNLELFPSAAVDNDTTTNFFRASLGNVNMANVTGATTMAGLGRFPYGGLWTAPNAASILLSFSFRVVRTWVHWLSVTS